MQPNEWKAGWIKLLQNAQPKRRHVCRMHWAPILLLVVGTFIIVEGMREALNYTDYTQYDEPIGPTP